MSRTARPAPIRFTAKLQRPAGRAAGWLFVVLPAAASARLPTRNAITVDGSIAEHAFRTTLQPDGRRSHWFKVTAAMLKKSRMVAGDRVAVSIAPSARQAEPRLPPDLRRALAAAPAARQVWSEISATARRDWVQWITTARQAETRARRIRNACDMLGSGKRRVCCFDRSGFYSGDLAAPVAAD